MSCEPVTLVFLGGIGLGVGSGWSEPLRRRLDIPDGVRIYEFLWDDIADNAILETFPHRGYPLTRRFWRRWGDSVFWADIKDMALFRLRHGLPADRPLHIVAHSWGGVLFHDAWVEEVIPQDPSGHFLRSVTTLGTPLALHVHPGLGHRPALGWTNFMGRFDPIGIPLSKKFRWVQDRRVWATHGGLLKSRAVAAHISRVVRMPAGGYDG